MTTRDIRLGYPPFLKFVVIPKGEKGIQIMTDDADPPWFEEVRLFKVYVDDAVYLRPKGLPESLDLFEATIDVNVPLSSEGDYEAGPTDAQTNGTHPFILGTARIHVFDRALCFSIQSNRDIGKKTVMPGHIRDLERKYRKSAIYLAGMIPLEAITFVGLEKEGPNALIINVGDTNRPLGNHNLIHGDLAIRDGMGMRIRKDTLHLAGGIRVEKGAQSSAQQLAEWIVGHVTEARGTKPTKDDEGWEWKPEDVDLSSWLGPRHRR